MTIVRTLCKICHDTIREELIRDGKRNTVRREGYCWHCGKRAFRERQVNLKKKYIH